MPGKILPIIAAAVLIAIYSVLFNSSLPKLEKTSGTEESYKISSVKTKDFFGSLTAPEKQLFLQLPCAPGSECTGKESLRGKFETSFSGNVIKKGLVIDQYGVELFSGKKIDPKYAKLISAAMTGGKAFLKEILVTGQVEQNRIISAIKISDILGDKSFDNKFILTLADANNDKPANPGNKFIYGAATFIPLLLIIFYFLKRKGGMRTGRKKAGNSSESNDYISQIEELKKVNIQQSQFLANFTHELRTPLNSIIGFSGLLKDQTLGNLGNPEYLKYANDINISGVHLLSLINDILDYSKSEAGKLKVNITEVDVVKVIKQTLSIISPRASESKVELQQSFGNDYFIIRIDPKRFKQIMLNLLSNSVKFTPEGGNVTVSVFPDIKGEKVSVEVKDSGVGIAEKDIPTVMSLFGQVETDLNRKYEGTGIGLPFAKKLTTLMGGSFDLESQVGVGTTVTLTFPFDKKLNAEYQELYKKQTS